MSRNVWERYAELYVRLDELNASAVFLPPDRVALRLHRAVEGFFDGEKALDLGAIEEQIRELEFGPSLGRPPASPTELAVVQDDQPDESNEAETLDKQCWKCAEVLPLTEFPANARLGGKRAGTCESCLRRAGLA